MGFDDNRAGEGDLGGNGGVIVGWDGGGVEEAAAVKELELFGLGTEVLEGIGNLMRDGAKGDGLGEGVLPEVAHQAAPGTFFVGQENAGGKDDSAGSGTLFFEEEGVGFKGVNDRAGWPPGGDPGGPTPFGKDGGHCPD